MMSAALVRAVRTDVARTRTLTPVGTPSTSGHTVQLLVRIRFAPERVLPFV